MASLNKLLKIFKISIYKQKKISSKHLVELFEDIAQIK